VSGGGGGGLDHVCWVRWALGGFESYKVINYLKKKKESDRQNQLASSASNTGLSVICALYIPSEQRVQQAASGCIEWPAAAAGCSCRPWPCWQLSGTGS
jgi:hypothetical protein